MIIQLKVFEQTLSVVATNSVPRKGSQEVPTNVVPLRLDKSNTLWEQDAPEPQSSWLAKVIDLNNHQSIPGENGYWMLWDTDNGAYVESDLPLPEVSGGGGSGGSWNQISDKPFNTIDGNTLVNRSGTLCVNTTDNAEQDDTRPITSSGVHVICGNVNALLQEI